MRAGDQDSTYLTSSSAFTPCTPTLTSAEDKVAMEIKVGKVLREPIMQNFHLGRNILYGYYIIHARQPPATVFFKKKKSFLGGRRSLEDT